MEVKEEARAGPGQAGTPWALIQILIPKEPTEEGPEPTEEGPEPTEEGPEPTEEGPEPTEEGPEHLLEVVGEAGEGPGQARTQCPLIQTPTMKP